MANIVNGYDLDGTAHPSVTQRRRAPPFVGTAGVGAMSDVAIFAPLRDGAYAGVATLKELDGQHLLHRVVDGAVARDDDRALLRSGGAVGRS